MDQPSHVPVMLDEVLEALQPKPGSLAVDGTLGLAGHALEIAKRIAPGGKLVGFDKDRNMLKIAEQRLQEVEDVTWTTVHDDYRAIPQHVPAGAAHSILLDMGLNNAQIEDPERGFSFRNEGPLDMRMDRTQGDSAAALLGRLSAQEIESLILEYGEDRWARRIAQVIVERRKKNPLRTTQDLVDCVLAAIPAGARDRRIHPATRTFQAVRIAVNRELDDLQEALESILQTLAPGGTCAVLAYHSGEDRAVKRAFRELSQGGEFEEITKKPLEPTEEETRRNPKSRSAKLRAIRRKLS